MVLKSLIAGLGILALGSTAMADSPVRPLFTYRPLNPTRFAPRTAVPTWTYKWTYAGTNYSAIFIGKKPTTGTSTTVPVYIIPIKLTYKTTVADPLAVDGTGNSPVSYTLSSPIFQAAIDYNQAGTDLGTTQYEDAFQRANLWQTVKTNPGYHVLLGTPIVKPEQSLTVPNSQGTVANAFGNTVIIANINWYDGQIQPLLTSLGIPQNALPIFITTQSYLSDNSGTSGCCIGGYHGVANSGLPYAQFTFITNTGATLAFSQDVSALSHEIGEWMDDPLTNNTNVPALCGTQGNGQQIYEVGDPIEVDANYGDYPYVLNGVTYHLQDLTLPTYFGAAAKKVVPGLKQTFQGTHFSVCQNGG